MLCGVLLFMSVVQPATAQEVPTVEISGGYTFLRDVTDEINFPAGWYADVAGNFSDWLGFVGMTTGSYKSEDIFGVEVDLNIHTFTFGPRFSSRANENVVPFAQVLVGVTRFSGSVNVVGLDVSESSSDFTLIPGPNLLLGSEGCR